LGFTTWDVFLLDPRDHFLTPTAGFAQTGQPAALVMTLNGALTQTMVDYNQPWTGVGAA